MPRRSRRNASRLFGPGTFDLQLGAGFLLVSFVLSLLLGQVFIGEQTTGGIALAHLLVHIGMFGAMFAANVLFKRPLEMGKIRLPTMVSLGAGIALVRLLLTASLFVQFGFEESFSEAFRERFGQSMLFGMTTYPLVGILGTIRARLQNARLSLVFQRIAKQADSEDQQLELRAFIDSARLRLQKASSNQEGRLIAEEIRKIVEEDLRPLSHRIWVRENSKLPNFRARDLLNMALKYYAYRPQVAMPIWFITTLFLNLTIFGIRGGIEVTSVRTLILTTVLSLALLLRPKSNTGVWIKFILVFGMAYSLQLWVGKWLAGVLDQPVFTPVFFGGLIWTLIVVIFTGMVWALLDSGSKIRTAIQDEFQEDMETSLEASQENLLRDRKMAQFLHGHLQGKLIATATKIDESSVQGSVSTALALIDEVLGQAVLDFQSQPRDLEQVQTELRADWGELVQLEFSVATLPSNLEPRTFERIKDTATEAISNAVRHGFAARVEIQATLEGDCIRIVAKDDGVGPREGKPGLGSFYLDSVSRSWDLTAGPTGSILTVELKL